MQPGSRLPSSHPPASPCSSLLPAVAVSHVTALLASRPASLRPIGRPLKATPRSVPSSGTRLSARRLNGSLFSLSFSLSPPLLLLYRSRCPSRPLEPFVWPLEVLALAWAPIQAVSTLAVANGIWRLGGRSRAVTLPTHVPVVSFCFRCKTPSSPSSGVPFQESTKDCRPGEVAASPRGRGAPGLTPFSALLD